MHTYSNTIMNASGTRKLSFYCMSLTRNYNTHTHTYIEENDQLAKCDKTHSRLDAKKRTQNDIDLYNTNK